jgi:hypothetical protein
MTEFCYVVGVLGSPSLSVLDDLEGIKCRVVPFRSSCVVPKSKPSIARLFGVIYIILLLKIGRCRHQYVQDHVRNAKQRRDLLL